MRKNVKRYTAILLIAAMVFPSSPVYGNMEDEYELLLESKDSEEYQKATDSNAQKNNEDEDIHEDEELIDDIQKASPSDAEEADKDEVELEQNLEAGKKIVSWKWKDKQEALIDGELQLAVTEVDQISFDDVVSMLPESITAEVLEDGKQQRQKFLCPVGIVIFIKLMKRENGQQKVNICLKRKCRMNMSWMLVQMN